MPYTEQEKQEFSQQHFPTSFVYDNSMTGKFSDKHVSAYNNWASYAMDIVHQKWYTYRSVKYDLDQAEETYNTMMGANIEFIEEETWNSLREIVINSLQLARTHNTHIMTFGKAGSCPAADGRAEWGTDCLFPSDMNQVVAMMPNRTAILIEGNKIFGEFGKRVDAMINKILSPDFRYNRAKKEAIEDAKRQQEYQQQQEAISHLKEEAQSLAQQQAEAWAQIQENPHSEDAEQLRIIYQQLEERKKQLEEEAKKAGVILKMMKVNNREQKSKELPRNFQTLYQGEDADSEQESFHTPTELGSEASTISNETNNASKFPTKELILGGLLTLIVGGVIYLIKNVATIF